MQDLLPAAGPVLPDAIGYPRGSQQQDPDSFVLLSWACLAQCLFFFWGSRRLFIFCPEKKVLTLISHLPCVVAWTPGLV